ncbi:MAG TPA: hypothetical protein HA330_00310 [Candidatus Thalassarchaeaceae archaeon]|nr:MAG TPA: hypothetical protein D7H85_00315 [Candidatus Poseidoniales archaeon]HII48303.1 hypothetical protein [Candidatus Thalassarchaeaceae archaeon]
MEFPDVAGEPWFPRGAVSTNPVPSEHAPVGFSSFEVPLSWTTTVMLWPNAGLPNLEVLQTWSESEDLWGDVTCLQSATSLAWTSGSLGPIGKMDCGRDGIWRIEILPFDYDGHGRRLSEHIGSNPYVAQGGLQWRGRDVLLFWRDLGAWPSAADVLESLIESEKLDDARILIEECGRALGRFHLSTVEVADPTKVAKRWNERLKVLEERTKSSTLWRAPHGRRTVGTLTHRNFSLRNIVVLNDIHSKPNLEDVHILFPGDGVYGALIPLEHRAPALQDLAAGYRSIERIEGGTSGMRIELRRCFLDGWRSTAPPRWASDDALDSHKGGVPIWEYEQVLKEVLYAHAFDDEIDPRTHWFLNHVDRIQAGMFRARTIAAGALTCTALLGFGIYAGVTELLEWSDSIPLMLCGLAVLPLRQLYRSLAPPPY